MKKKTEELLMALIGELEGKEDFKEVKDQLFKRGVESLLQAELTAHLGYTKGSSPLVDNVRNGTSEKTIKTEHGEHRIKVPRD